MARKNPGPFRRAAKEGLEKGMGPFRYHPPKRKTDQDPKKDGK